MSVVKEERIKNWIKKKTDASRRRPIYTPDFSDVPF
jgi:hypothetical protein